MTSPTRHIRLHASTTEDGKGLAQLRDDLQRAAKGADGLGASMGDLEGDAKGLDAQIGQTKKRIKELGEEFEATGDRSLFRELGKERSHLRQLEKISSELVDEAEDVGKKAGKSLASGMGSSLSMGFRGPLIAGIVGIIGGASVPIGAALAGAITGVAGIGGLAGGIAAASRSPAVKEAASIFASNVSSAFFQYGDEFVEPLVGAFKILEEGFHDLNLEDAFNKVAGYVDDLAYGLAGFGENFMVGFSKALDTAGPALELLGESLPSIGRSFGYMFERIAAGEGTLEGFLAFIGLLKGALNGIGNILNFLSNRFDEFVGFMIGFTGIMEDLDPSGGFDRLNDSFEKLRARADDAGQTLNYSGRQLTNTAGAAEATAAAINKLNDELYETQNNMLALSNATLAYEAGLIQIRDQVDENGASLKRNTEVGNENRQMINNLVGALMRERDAAIEAAEGNEAKVDAANDAYAAQMKKLQELLVKLGFEEAQINDIIGAYKAIPRRVTTEIIQEYQRQGVPLGEHTGPRIGELGHRAAGGPVQPGVPYMINEAGRETVTFPAAGTVHPASLSPMTSTARPLHVTVSGHPYFQELFNAIVREVGNRGGTLAVIGVRE